MQLVTMTGQAYSLKIGGNTIGRGRGNDIVLEDRAMSRRHAELYWDGRQCVVTDLGSTNGTFLNGRRLGPHQPQPAPPGARLGFGPTMAVTLSAEAVGAETVYAAPGPSPSPSPTTGLDLMFRALDAALDYRKLGLTILGFLIAGIVSALFAWLFAQIAIESMVLGIAIGLMGLVVLWIILAFVAAAITRLLLIELDEGRKGEVREAVRYAGQHLLTFLLSPLALVVGVVLILVGETVFLLVGRIEYLGELVVSLAFLPLVALNLVVLLVAWFGTVLTYPIIADRGGGIGDTLSHVLTIVRRVPGRLAAYMMLAGLASLLALLFCFYLLFSALYVTSALTAVGMEPLKFLMVSGGMPFDVSGLIPGLSYGLFGEYLWSEPPATYAIARFLFGLSGLGLMMVVLAVPQLLYLAGVCAVYLTLRRQVSGPGPELGGTGGRPVVGASQMGGPKPCWQCGAPLAHGQAFCPYCGQRQQ